MSVADWLDKPVRISRGRVFFGDAELPGVIAEGGVRIHAGGAGEYHTMTVEFIVGEVIAEEPHELDRGAHVVTERESGLIGGTGACG
ncbi:hypothetical protein PBI_NEBKISS_170 [Mycobacterium phage Nebkiss]|nr:hypothetical protein PBI_NEBKISS_170 [Mycobacterium phage Nebkiss]